MIEHVLHQIGGVGVYGVLSVCLFVGVFTVVLVWALRLKKSYLKTMRELPLDGGECSPRNRPPSAPHSHE